MKKIAMAVVLLTFFSAVQAMGQIATPADKSQPEKAKTKIAVINFNRVVNGGGINYEKLRLLSLDPATLEALNKVEKDIRDIQMQITDVEDEVTMNDLARRLEFLNRKSMLLRQRNTNSSQDFQSAFRNFVIETYKDKYDLILQPQEGHNQSMIVWKGNANLDDITDEARGLFVKYLDQFPVKSPREMHGIRSPHNPASVPPAKSNAPASGGKANKIDHEDNLGKFEMIKQAETPVMPLPVAPKQPER